MKRLLSHLLIQHHFDYGCTSWFPLLNRNVKHKLLTTQNKCIRLCLDLPPHFDTGVIHLRKIK